MELSAKGTTLKSPDAAMPQHINTSFTNLSVRSCLSDLTRISESYQDRGEAAVRSASANLELDYLTSMTMQLRRSWSIPLPSSSTSTLVI
jgi:hypothetical protein